MAYSKTTWENLPSTNTPINATNLNKIENQLKNTDGNETSEITFTCTGNIFTTHNLRFYKIAESTYFVTGAINKASGTSDISEGTTTDIGTFNKKPIVNSTLAIASSNNSLDGHVAIWASSGIMALQIPSSGRIFNGSYFLVSGIIRTSN